MFKSATELVKKYAQFSEEERKIMEDALKGEAKNKTVSTNYKQDYDKAQKEWEDAKKKLSEIEKDKSKFTSKQYEEAKKREKTSREAYEALGGITGSSLTKQENKAKKDAGKQIKLQEELSEKLLSLHKKNQQDEIDLMEEGRAKKIAEIAADFDAQKQAIEKQAKEIAKANKKAGVKDVGEDGLTSVQRAVIDKAKTLNKEKREHAENDIYKQEAEAMRDYLKEYGTFQQKKLAIAEEYAEKIRKAQSEGERLTLEKQRDSAIQQVEVEAIKQSVDWGSVFGGFGAMFKEQLQPTIDRLKAISHSEGFMSSSLQDQQALYELITKLEQASATWDSDIFKRVSEDMTAYQTAMQEYIEAQERERQATEALAGAKRGLREAEKSGDLNGATGAQVRVKEAETALNAASDDVARFGKQVQQTTADLQSSSTQAVNMFQGLESGLKGLTSGSLQGIGQGIIQLDKLFNKGELTKDAANSLAKGFQSLLGKDSSASKAISEALGDTGLAGEIISGTLGMLDLLKDGFSGILVSLQDTIFNAIEGILEDVLKGGVITKPLMNLGNHVGTILNTVTFGGFNSLFGIGGNGKEVQEAINKLADRNETLQTAIEDLTDVMEASKGTKSVSAYADAKKLQKETEENYKKIAQNQAKYTGAHGSWNHYWRGFNQEEISRLSQQIGRDWNGDIWSLSPDEMKVLRSNVDMWEKIQNTGKGNYGGRLTEKLDDYIAQAGKLEELTDKLYEGLTGITFDGMFDSFVNNLMDMEYEARDAAEDISEYFMRAMLSNKIGEMYSDKLEEWWKKFGAGMEDNNLTEEEREALQDEYMQYVEEAMKIRDKLAAATGYDKIADESTSQSSTSRGFGTEMTHEDAGELSGRFTALQVAGEEIRNQNIIQSQSLSLLTAKADVILSINTETRNIADDTRDLIAQSYLELVQISENTGAIVKPIQQIQKDIAEVKNNTSKL